MGIFISGPAGSCRDPIHFSIPAPSRKRVLETSAKPSFDSLCALFVSTISKFKSSRLRAPIRRPGQSTEPPPEAQYQQEFYRCVLETTLGHVRVTPEFASAKNAKVTGRIDLLFQSQNGGLRSLETEALLAPRGQDACFQDNGVYGAWMKSGIMDDYIFLDFCRAVPKQPHPSTASGLSLPPLLICFQILRICFTLCLMTNIKPPRSTTKMSNS